MPAASCSTRLTLTETPAPPVSARNTITARNKRAARQTRGALRATKASKSPLKAKAFSTGSSDSAIKSRLSCRKAFAGLASSAVTRRRSPVISDRVFTVRAPQRRGGGLAPDGRSHCTGIRKVRQLTVLVHGSGDHRSRLYGSILLRTVPVCNLPAVCGRRMVEPLQAGPPNVPYHGIAQFRPDDIVTYSLLDDKDVQCMSPEISGRYSHEPEMSFLRR